MPVFYDDFIKLKSESLTTDLVETLVQASRPATVERMETEMK